MATTSENVLALLTSCGEAEFREILSHVHYLSNVFTPLYSLDELTEIVSGFRSHLITETESYEQTGYPSKLFLKSKWLDAYLNRLYFTKYPEATKSPKGLLTLHWKRGQTGRGKTKYGDYEAASHLPLLREEDVLKIEELRPRVQAIRIALMRILRDALKKSSLEHLWTGCQTLLTEYLTQDDANFLIRLDKFYDRHGLVPLGDITFPGIPGTGGISDLLMVVGHVEQELRIESHHQIWQLFNRFIYDSKAYESRFDTIEFLRKVVFGHRKHLHNFLSQLRQLRIQTDRGWNEYHERARHFLDLISGGGNHPSTKEAVRQAILDGENLSPFGQHGQFQKNQVAHQSHTNKPVLLVYPNYAQAKLDDNVGIYGEKVIFGLRHILETQKGCLKYGLPVMFDRNGFCDAVGIGQGPSRYTALRDVFRKTPFATLLVKVPDMRNKRILLVDMSKSQVI